MTNAQLTVLPGRFFFYRPNLSYYRYLPSCQ